jgi:hypothetical protein
MASSNPDESFLTYMAVASIILAAVFIGMIIDALFG